MRSWLCLAVMASLVPVAASQQQAASELDRAAEEFKVQTANLGVRADSPRKQANGGSRRQWHGRVFEYFRNNSLDAVPHEIVQRGGRQGFLRRNQFGFNVAGPVFLPKIYDGGKNTFFSLSYEGAREGTAATYLRTIPTALERVGDWSRTVDQAGRPLPIYDPATTSRNPRFDATQPVTLENLEYERSPFPGNIVPSSRLDARARGDLALYPNPNTNVGPFFRNNYFVNNPDRNTANGVIGKVDHSIGEKSRLTFETTISNGTQTSARLFPTQANPGPPDRLFSTRRGSAEHVYTPSPQIVNTISFSVSSSRNSTVAQNFPQYQFQPYLSMGRAYPVSRNANNHYAWSDGVSVRRGKHALRGGGQYSRHEVNTFWPQYPNGYFRFGSGLTSLPGIVNTGHAFASFILGLAEYAEVSIVPQPAYFRRGSWDFWFRDQYEVRKGLSVNVSMSLSRWGGRYEKFDRQSTIDLGAINPANGRNGALVAANTGGWGRAFQPTPWRLSPSASLAWSPRGTTKTVVRAGYSRGYSPVPIYTGQWGTQGFVGYPTFYPQNAQLQPALVLANGFPALPSFPDLRPDGANNTVADLIDTSHRQPLYQSASLTVERELRGSVVLSVGAAYSGGRDLMVSNSAADPNAIRLEDLVYRDQLNDETFNRSRRPYPQFRGFDVYSSYPIGRYRRDSGYVRVEKRASAGLSLSAYYEFSKQLDDYSGPYGKQDFFSRKNEWSLSSGNEPHRFQMTYAYELPFGANKPLLRTSDWWRYVVDGWSVTGVTVLQSGEPIAIHPQFNNTGGVVKALNADVVPGVDPRVPNQGPDLWYNPAAFAHPADFEIGNASRTHPQLRNPGGSNYDLTLAKRMNLAPDRTLELSAAGFNVMNHGNWTDPDPLIGTASSPNVNAGKIIGSRGGRVIQLGLKISF
ncbi:MAG: hypothetical protein ACKV22_32465 [Bryobacteraceae bacterium]